MSDRCAEYPEDYQHSIEHRSSVQQVARDAKGEQRDQYAQPPYFPVFNYWNPYAADDTDASGAADAHAGTYGSAANPAWAYGGRNYGDLSYTVGAAE